MKLVKGKSSSPDHMIRKMINWTFVGKGAINVLDSIPEWEDLKGTCARDVALLLITFYVSSRIAQPISESKFTSESQIIRGKKDQLRSLISFSPCKLQKGGAGNQSERREITRNKITKTMESGKKLQNVLYLKKQKFDFILLFALNVTFQPPVHTLLSTHLIITQQQWHQD